jgi:predicted small lipoprotein YifL
VKSRLLSVVALATVAAALAGCGGSGSLPTNDEYEQAVVQAIQRTDYALARITRAKSKDELLKRMDEAEVAITAAADDLDEHGAPEVWTEENEKLVTSMGALGNDVGLTAEQIRQPGFESLLLGARGLSFENWDKVNLALASLIGDGLRVPTLQPHAPES